MKAIQYDMNFVRLAFMRTLHECGFGKTFSVSINNNKQFIIPYLRESSFASQRLLNTKMQENAKMRRNAPKKCTKIYQRRLKWIFFLSFCLVTNVRNLGNELPLRNSNQVQAIQKQRSVILPQILHFDIGKILIRSKKHVKK